MRTKKTIKNRITFPNALAEVDPNDMSTGGPGPLPRRPEESRADKVRARLGIVPINEDDVSAALRWSRGSAPNA